MREFLKQLRKHLDISEGAFIRGKDLIVDEQYSSCGHLERTIRKVTKEDQAYFLIEKKLWKKEQDEIKEAELQQLAYLKEKYKGVGL